MICVNGLKSYFNPACTLFKNKKIFSPKSNKQIENNFPKNNVWKTSKIQKKCEEIEAK
jgi:hypothetical protein